MPTPNRCLRAQTRVGPRQTRRMVRLALLFHGGILLLAGQAHPAKRAPASSSPEVPADRHVRPCGTAHAPIPVSALHGAGARVPVVWSVTPGQAHELSSLAQEG